MSAVRNELFDNIKYVDEFPTPMEAINDWVVEVQEKNPTHRFIAGLWLEHPEVKTRHLLCKCLCSTNTATAFVKHFKELTNIGLPGTKPAVTEELKEIIELCLKTKNDERVVILFHKDGYETYRAEI